MSREMRRMLFVKEILPLIAIVTMIGVSRHTIADDEAMTGQGFDNVQVFHRTCRPVYGKFFSESVPLPECNSPIGICTKGELRGGLRGQYFMTMSQRIPSGEPAASFVSFFSGQSEIELSSGDILVGVDAGSLNGAPPDQIGSGAFSTLLTLTAGASGYLHIRGTFDWSTGLCRGRYSGLVCSDR